MKLFHARFINKHIFLDRWSHFKCLYLYLLGVFSMNLDIWGSTMGSFVQTQDFCFSMGHILSPLILQVFSSNLFNSLISQNTHVPLSTHSNNITNLTTLSFINTNLRTLSFINTTNYTADIADFEKRTNFEYAYLTIGILNLISSLHFWWNWYHQNSPDKLNNNINIGQDEENQAKHQLGQGHTSSKCQRNIILAIGFLYFIFYDGVTETYTGLATTFAKDYLSWDRTHSTLINSVFWGFFSCSQLVAIFIVKFVHPRLILFVCLVVLVCSLCVLVAASSSSPLVVWICTAFIAASAAPTFANTVTWINVHIPVSGVVIGIWQVAESIGGSVVPSLAGVLFQHFGGMCFAYVCLTCGIAMLLCLILMAVMVTKYSKYQNTLERCDHLTECTQA